MQIIVKGGAVLKGEARVSTSKNAALPILAASLLTDEPVKIEALPRISDVAVFLEMLREVGTEVSREDDAAVISGEIYNVYPAGELVRRMRGSFLILGPILARKKQARISLPGGCSIGSRPVDLHIKGLRQLGAAIRFAGGDVVAEAPRLRGGRVYLDFPSVGATENIMMAAALAEGTTLIENAALEPEVMDLARFINAMGGRINGIGSSLLKIEGVPALHGCTYTPIPDRIEAGSLMVAVAASGGEGIVRNVIPEHSKAVSAKLRESGAEVEEFADAVFIRRRQPILPVYVKTLPYPGFPTDMQAQMMAYLCGCTASSIISETIFENRYLHVPELLRMGADIRLEGRAAIIRGRGKLSGARVKATDLRAGAALLIAGLSARGETVVEDCEHLGRGYEDFPAKLRGLGAEIEVTFS